MKWAPRGFGGDRLSPEYFKKHGWHVEGVLVIRVDDDRLTWPERELIRQLAERLYGVKEKSNAENTAQRRALKRRRIVDRTERVKPSPLAEAKKRPWTMMVLLDRGPEAQGITAEQFEAGIDVADAFEALTRALGYRAASPEAVVMNRGWDRFLSMSPRAARLTAIYLAWAPELQRRLCIRGHVVMEWVQDERCLTAADLPRFVRALDLWCKHRDEWRADSLTKPPAKELTASSVVEVRPERISAPTLHFPNVPDAATAIASPRAVAPLTR